MKAEDVPAWYNYEYQIKTALEAGKDSTVWNYSVVNFQYTGGAHPNTLAKYMNINAQTGKLLLLMMYSARKIMQKSAH